MTSPRRTPHETLARRVLDFWFVEAGPGNWFRGGPSFDAEIRDRFICVYRAAAARDLESMRSTPNGALALVIVLDQFSRNLFRSDARAFASDAYAQNIARAAIARRFDLVHPPKRRAFFYMPFMHSEDIADQDLCVRLFKTRAPQTGNLPHAIEHRDIIRRFGRFPHRNETLGRAATEREQQYLRNGGFRA